MCLLGDHVGPVEPNMSRSMFLSQSSRDADQHSSDIKIVTDV